MREGSKKDQFSRGGASLTQNLGHLAAAKWHTILKEVDKGIWRNRRLRNRTTFDMKEHDLLLLRISFYPERTRLTASGECLVFRGRGDVFPSKVL